MPKDRLKAVDDMELRNIDSHTLEKTIEQLKEDQENELSQLDDNDEQTPEPVENKSEEKLSPRLDTPNFSSVPFYSLQQTQICALIKAKEQLLEELTKQSTSKKNKKFIKLIKKEVEQLAIKAEKLNSEREELEKSQRFLELKVKSLKAQLQEKQEKKKKSNTTRISKKKTPKESSPSPPGRPRSMSISSTILAALDTGKWRKEKEKDKEVKPTTRVEKYEKKRREKEKAHSSVHINVKNDVGTPNEPPPRPRANSFSMAPDKRWNSLVRKAKPRSRNNFDLLQRFHEGRDNRDKTKGQKPPMAPKPQGKQRSPRITVTKLSPRASRPKTPRADETQVQ